MDDAIRYAEEIYYDRKRSWNKIAERAMKADFSWSHSAKEYEKLYNEGAKSHIFDRTVKVPFCGVASTLMKRIKLRCVLRKFHTDTRFGWDFQITILEF